MLSAVLVLLLFPPSFPPFSGSSTSKISALKLNLNPFLAEKSADSASSAHFTRHSVHISPKLEPSSADIERRGAADPRPPNQGGGREGGRWESGWRPERVLAVLAGLADRTDRGRGLAVPLSTKTPRKRAGRSRADESKKDSSCWIFSLKLDKCLRLCLQKYTFSH